MSSCIFSLFRLLYQPQRPFARRKTHYLAYVNHVLTPSLSRLSSSRAYYTIPFASGARTISFIPRHQRNLRLPVVGRIEHDISCLATIFSSSSVVISLPLAFSVTLYHTRHLPADEMPTPNITMHKSAVHQRVKSVFDFVWHLLPTMI